MVVFRRVALWLIIAVTVASACSEPAATEVATATTTDIEESAQEGDDVEPVSEASEETTPQPGLEVVDAALAAGQPVVLWFWGAH